MLSAFKLKIMYYKIENKESEVYKKLHEQRTKEQQMELKNIASIIEKTGLNFTQFFGRRGQQNFRRVTFYNGFEFTEPEKVDLKIWKRDKEYTEIFVPNTRTKLGREMQEFLNNGLEGSMYGIINDILGLETLPRFTFPFVEIIGEKIIIMVDDQYDLDDKDIIEITKREFEEARLKY